MNRGRVVVFFIVVLVPTEVVEATLSASVHVTVPLCKRHTHYFILRRKDKTAKSSRLVSWGAVGLKTDLPSAFTAYNTIASCYMDGADFRKPRKLKQVERENTSSHFVLANILTWESKNLLDRACNVEIV